MVQIVDWWCIRNFCKSQKSTYSFLHTRLQPKNFFRSVNTYALLGSRVMSRFVFTLSCLYNSFITVTNHINLTSTLTCKKGLMGHGTRHQHFTTRLLKMYLFKFPSSTMLLVHWKCSFVRPPTVLQYTRLTGTWTKLGRGRRPYGRRTPVTERQNKKWQSRDHRSCRVSCLLRNLFNLRTHIPPIRCVATDPVDRTPGLTRDKKRSIGSPTHSNHLKN